MAGFKLKAPYSPRGDQQQAVDALVAGLAAGEPRQTLLGVTGSGKTFTLANVIERVNRPTLVISHNKTLAAQLYAEFKAFFPENAVEYFVSYYDYYQPEAYIPQTDTYIEKDAEINEHVDRLRHSATQSLLSRRDVLIVASVSCIYGLGSPEDYMAVAFNLKLGQTVNRRDIFKRLVRMQFVRNDTALDRGSFRARGDVIEMVPADEPVIWRVELFDDEIESIKKIDLVSGEVLDRPDYLWMFPATHYVLLPEKIPAATARILSELEERLAQLQAEGRDYEAHRLESRTRYDLEMIEQIGYCKGIENYSRHFADRKPGEQPYTLIDYFPDDLLVVIDESHVTVPQLRGMVRGDRSRKDTLVEHGFRLPSAYDNRPLTFDEFESAAGQQIYASATPSPFELEVSTRIVEQIIRPTGLVDPAVEVRPAENQVSDLMAEIEAVVERDLRVLVTTLTKRMAEDLTEYFQERGLKVQYLHSDIDTLQRVRILKELRSGRLDVVVGINLLREGLDLPEVALVAILDADKEGFLRSETALIQTIGRAARNVSGKVLLYAVKTTEAMDRALRETDRRRRIQMEHNRRSGITPVSIEKSIDDMLPMPDGDWGIVDESTAAGSEPGLMPPDAELLHEIIKLEKQMKQAADMLEFERAARLRDRLVRLQAQASKLGLDPGSQPRRRSGGKRAGLAGRRRNR